MKVYVSFGKYSFIVLSSIFILMVLLGFKRFVLWEQVLSPQEYSFGENVFCEQKIISQRPVFQKLGRVPSSGEERLVMENASTLCLGNKKVIQSDKLSQMVHWPRRLMVMPIIFLAQKVQVNPHKIFSFFVCFLLFLTTLLVSDAIRRLISPHVFWASLQIFGEGLILISLFMNGRIMFSFLASSLLIWVYACEKEGKLDWRGPVGLFGALMASNVSTGVNAIVFAACSAYLFSLFMNQLGKLKYKYFSLLAILIWSPWFVAGLLKNINYYGGGGGAIWKMFHHGAGKLFLSAQGFSVLVFLSALIFFSRKRVLQTIKGEREILFLYLLVFLGLVGGVFGYSALSQALLPILTVTFYKLFKSPLMEKA